VIDITEDYATGLAGYGRLKEIPTFTDGLHHCALEPDRNH